MILGKVVSSLFDYGLSFGWGKIFKGKSDTCRKKLEDILKETITEFEKKHYRAVVDGKFPFYHSQILLEDILKLRLFKNESQQEIIHKINGVLKTNDNIQQPSEEEISSFYAILIKNLNSDAEFKKIEIDTHYKEIIFQTYDQVKILRDELKAINIDEIGLLKREYETQVDDIYEEIKLLRFSTGLKKLKKLEIRIKSNIKASSKLILSRVEFVKAICHDHIDENDLAKECYIKAYLLNNDDIKNIEIACWVYFKQNDNTFKTLLNQLELIDPFNPYAWAIKAINADKVEEYIQQTPLLIREDFRYKRNIYNYLIYHNTYKIKEIEFLFNNIQYDIPNEVTYDNLNDLIFLANIYFSRFVNTVHIDFVRQTEVTDQSKHLYDILEKLNAVKFQSELGPSFNQLCLTYTWLKSEMYFNQVSVNELIKTYKEVEKPDKMFALFIANSLQKRGDVDAALKLIEEYDEDEILLSLKLFCQPNFETAKRVAEKYLSSIQGIDKNNVANICAFLESIVKQKIYSKEELLSVIHSKECSTEHFRELLLLLTETYSNEEKVKLENILTLKEYLADYDYLNIFIAILLYNNNYYQESVEFVLPQINDIEKPDLGALKILIYAINDLRTEHQEKLPRLLRLWRENFEPNPQFLSMEIMLYTHLKKWDKIKEINKFALNTLPNNEYFFTSYIDSLSQTKDYVNLANIVDDIVNFNFEYLENAIFVSDLLIRNKHFNEGFDLLYRYANEKTNIKARWHFFQISTIYHDNPIFHEYQTVHPECFVKFRVNGTSQTKFISNVEATDDLTQSLINKKKGDSFTIIKKLSGKIVSINIERIINKYVNLLLEIQEEFKNPASDYPVEVINFKAGDIDSFKHELITTFGIKNDLNKIKLKKNLEEYFQYQSPFFGIVAANFDEDQIATYYTLISKDSNGFMVNPQKLDIRKLDIENTSLVLDFTSGLLLFELTKSSNIEFKQKFIVGQSLIDHIESLIYKTKTNTSNLSVDIRGDGIIPFYKPENFTINRIKFLTEVHNWFTSTCKVEIPLEKVNYSLELHKQNQYEKGMNLLIETSLLANRPNHILLSDDLVYTQHLNMSNRQISTDHFLVTFYTEKRKEIFSHLIQNRYIGINFYSSDLYNCYIEKNHLEKTHVYEFCIRNLEVFYMLNAKGCNSIILDFLKKMATNPIYNEQILEIEARNIFTRCLSLNISKEILTDLALKTTRLFKLLPTYFDALRRAIDDSIEIVDNN
ncbi:MULTISPECIES: PIN domain-containing protein [unclassified Sphingobacterium]|uniref:PIN domain-containing protein n=1 Tax=unclassified Sphingobacterium TaxID=2609468 RepID=UPI0025CD25D2|nr:MULTISPECIES: hypothetical protein [unclassified Sphingobacterium]